MLPRKFRIGVRSKIAYILKKGHGPKSHFFYSKLLPNKISHNRFAVIVSKKISPKAVERNLIKRRMYEALRRNVPVLTKSCYDIIITVSPRAKDAPYAALEKDLLSLLSSV